MLILYSSADKFRKDFKLSVYFCIMLTVLFAVVLVDECLYKDEDTYTSYIIFLFIGASAPLLLRKL